MVSGGVSPFIRRRRSNVTGTFKLMRSADKQFYFCLLASNGRCLVTSEMYRTRQSMDKGVAAVRKLADSAKTDDWIEWRR